MERSEEEIVETKGIRNMPDAIRYKLNLIKPARTPEATAMVIWTMIIEVQFQSGNWAIFWSGFLTNSIK